MSLVISLSSELEEKLRRRAGELGMDADTFARKAVEEKLRGPRSLDEILAPFRQQVAQSGMTDQQADEFYESLRDEVWQEQQGRKNG